jgi:hypothetical protein
LHQVNSDFTDRENDLTMGELILSCLHPDPSSRAFS